MNKLKNILYILGLSIAMIFTGCSDPDDEVLSIDYDRLFSPTELKLQIANRTNVLVLWNSVKKAESYTIEVFDNGDLNFEGTPVMTLDGIAKNGTLSDPYIIQGLEGETDYSIRIKAISASVSDSKWSSEKITTATEQILEAVADADRKATEVTLRWPAGITATQMVLTALDKSGNPVGDNIIHTITAQEITNGAVTIKGLKGYTSYTAKLMNGTKTRGTATFKTRIEGATEVSAEENLIELLDAAKDGDKFALFPGEYDLGEYTFTKSVSIIGLESSDRPVLTGKFTCSTSVNSLEFSSLIIKGKGDLEDASFFDLGTSASLNSLTISDCEISNYKNQLISSSGSGVMGDLVISNCIIHDIEGSGGDGIDFRGGTLGSLKVENTTFYNAFRTFLRMQAKAGPISFTNCTFYKVSNYDNGNNHGLFRISNGDTFQVKNCLFVETGNETTTVTTAGNFCRQASNMKATASYASNIYYSCYQLWAGLYTNPTECAANEADPQFKDPAKGDFTVQNIVVNAGDPRWLE
ncbi:MAG: DUF5123 domain-containing protein [Dysgonomonas sp.]